jgi:hypothetical protein
MTGALDAPEIPARRDFLLPHGYVETAGAPSDDPQKWIVHAVHGFWGRLQMRIRLAWLAASAIRAAGPFS